MVQKGAPMRMWKGMGYSVACVIAVCEKSEHRRSQCIIRPVTLEINSFWSVYPVHKPIAILCIYIEYVGRKQNLEEMSKPRYTPLTSCPIAFYFYFRRKRTDECSQFYGIFCTPDFLHSPSFEKI